MVAFCGGPEVAMHMYQYAKVWSAEIVFVVVVVVVIG